MINLPYKKLEEPTYNAEDIEVLEGLEPVRHRPGMYIGGTDENAMHHLVNEILDNAMDEAVAGFAGIIEIYIKRDNFISIKDNGRGIPIDLHPKYPGKSALEVIMTTLHSGGKFNNKIYKTAGGLHGVGISVVNALSDQTIVEVIRNGSVHEQRYSKGIVSSELKVIGEEKRKKGTTITFHPDPEIFGNAKFDPKKIYNLAKSKAYLYKNVEIKWKVDKELIENLPEIPETDQIKFPEGLSDYVKNRFKEEEVLFHDIFSGSITVATSDDTKVEWAIGWTLSEPLIQSYCNTIPTPQGGSHEAGFKNAIMKSIKTYADLTGNKKANNITIDDFLSTSCVVLSIFIKDPLFQGQTKDKLVSANATKIVDHVIKDHFENWLTTNKNLSEKLIEHLIFIAEDRLSRRSEKNVNRKTITDKLKLPGKLTDCAKKEAEGTELFIVEGDAAGGSAKKARDRITQAILPIKGKILNVANSSIDKIKLNQQISDIEVALSCGSLGNYKEENLRYEKIIIMTDADVDGAHIASLLMTLFYKRMPKLIENGHLYLAKPPLFRMTQGGKNYYAANESERDKLVKKLGKRSKAKIDVGRFKGLGEMNADQLKETTMDIATRTLIKVEAKNFDDIKKIVDDLMGNKPEKRFQFIHEQSINQMHNIKQNLDI